MSHQVKLEGSFGEASFLKEALSDAKLSFKEGTNSKGEAIITVADRYNPWVINLDNPKDSTVDSDARRLASSVFQASMAKTVAHRAIVAGFQVESQNHHNGNVVLTLKISAVG